MKKLVMFICIFILSDLICIGQITYFDLVANAIKVEHTSITSSDLLQFNDGKVPSYKLRAIINKDIFEYNNLDEYDTDLKRKLFLETKEGISMYQEINKLNAQYKKKKFYYLHKLHEPTGIFKDDGDRYNINTHRFETYADAGEFTHNTSISSRGYINFSTLCLSSIPAIQRGPITKVFGVRQSFSVPLMNEGMALEIENNIADCAILFIFNLEKIKKLKTQDIFSEMFWFGKTIAVYIVNTKTGKIYSDTPVVLPDDVKLYLKEQKHKQIAAEKERQAEIERRKQERRNKIDSYLAGVDKNKVYNMSDDMQSAYYAMMKSAVAEAVSQYAPDNIDISVADSVIVNATGNTYHNIKVNFKTGVSPEEIENAIDAAVSSLNLYVMKLPIPDTDTTYSVNSQWKFIVPYKIETEHHNLTVIKKRSELILKKGSENFFNSNKSAITSTLGNKGKYRLNVWRQDIDGRNATEVETLDYLKPVGSVMLGYSFSPAAPLGFMFALNNVYSKHWGAYLSLRTSVKGQESVDDLGPYVMQWTPKGYTCFNFNVGATYSITKYGFIYAGIGYGQCGRYYVGEYYDGWSSSLLPEGEPAKVKTPKNKGLGMEAGIIVRPLKWLGASVGYNFVPGGHYGECNFGVLFFFN